MTIYVNTAAGRVDQNNLLIGKELGGKRAMKEQRHG